MVVWSVVLLGTSVGELVFGSVASRSGVERVPATSKIIGYSSVGRVVLDLKWISDISSE